ncbi:hypothetical protein C1646_763465 [Rhizophagus diaphanus]|nr:hypothetical protein C1646_763465 [Rhizophagus diaphanus] [Rhizophagus sp. MUCL 43196]
MPEPEEYDYFIQEIPPPSQRHLPIMKIFLDIYVDDFGTFWNVYHSLGGVYLQIANFEDFIKPVLQCLESGLVMKTINGDVWIIGGLGCVTADLPQGKKMHVLINRQKNVL